MIDLEGTERGTEKDFTLNFAVIHSTFVYTNQRETCKYSPPPTSWSKKHIHFKNKKAPVSPTLNIVHRQIT